MPLYASATLPTKSAYTSKSGLMSAGVLSANSLSSTASFFRSCEEAAPDMACENFWPRSASSLQLPVEVRPERSSPPPESVVVASVVAASVVVASVVAASVVAASVVVAVSSVVAAAFLLPPPQPAATSTIRASEARAATRIAFWRIGLLCQRVVRGVQRHYVRAVCDATPGFGGRTPTFFRRAPAPARGR